jgi:hypothetical protein
LDDVLVYTEEGAITSDCVDPTICLGFVEDGKFFGTLDNIEVLPFIVPPPVVSSPNESTLEFSGIELSTLLTSGIG